MNKDNILLLIIFLIYILMLFVFAGCSNKHIINNYCELYEPFENVIVHKNQPSVIKTARKNNNTYYGLNCDKIKEK